MTSNTDQFQFHVGGMQPVLDVDRLSVNLAPLSTGESGFGEYPNCHQITFPSSIHDASYARLRGFRGGSTVGALCFAAPDLFLQSLSSYLMAEQCPGISGSVCLTSLVPSPLAVDFATLLGRHQLPGLLEVHVQLYMLINTSSFAFVMNACFALCRPSRSFSY